MVFITVICLVVLNATFNNISVISWQSVLLVGEKEGPIDIRGRNCMVVGFTTTYEVSAYHH
jgi:hypothetical protein